jgi:hypothetical protein
MMRRRLVIATVALAGLAAAWSGVWVYVAGMVEQRFAAWAQVERARGGEVAYRQARVTGFPIGWLLVIEDYTLIRAQPTSLKVSGPRLDVHLLPWRLDDVPVRLPGEHVALLPALSAEAVAFAAARPEARVSVTPEGRLVDLRIDFGELRARQLAGGAPITAARLQAQAQPIVPPDPRSGESLVVKASVDDATVPQPPRPLAARIRRAEIELAVRGELARGGDAASAIRAWRESGGVLEIRHLAVDWEPVLLTGNGTAALDQQYRPEAAFTLKLVGHEAVVDGLVSVGQLRAREAAAIKLTLGLLARPNAGSGKNEIQVPVTIQDGKLTILKFPIPGVRVPPLQLAP